MSMTAAERERFEQQVLALIAGEEPYLRGFPPEVRFWYRVQKSSEPNGCWMWTGRVGTNGYGLFRIKPSPKQPASAHRVSYEMKHGPIPQGFCVLHACDKPLCVNPSHLFLGTQADNMRDMANKGRSAKAPLSESQVLELRAKHATGKYRRVELADEYGISPTAVRYIVTRKTWENLP